MHPFRKRVSKINGFFLPCTDKISQQSNKGFKGLKLCNGLGRAGMFPTVDFRTKYVRNFTLLWDGQRKKQKNIHEHPACLTSALSERDDDDETHFL